MFVTLVNDDDDGDDNGYDFDGDDRCCCRLWFVSRSILYVCKIDICYTSRMMYVVKYKEISRV